MEYTNPNDYWQHRPQRYSRRHRRGIILIHLISFMAIMGFMFLLFALALTLKTLLM